MNVDESQTSGGFRPREARARILAALGDPTRLAVVDLLQEDDLSPDALSAALEVSGNLLAHHLKVLEGVGIVARRASQNDRRRTYVHLVEGTLDDLLAPVELIAAPRVVFVCTHNSARSVLAEAIWNGVSTVPSASAGTHPADRVNHRAVTAARRADLDLRTDVPRSIDDVLRPDDVIVSVCDAVNEELGPLPNLHLHWSIPDPARQDTDEAFNEAMTEIRERVAHLAPRVRYRRNEARRRRT
jgi:protein-tyrosine-phosphatase/DNA-binding HxlR family transcriptional regulator